MTMYAIKKDTTPVTAVKSVIKKLLSEKIVDAVLIVARTPHSELPMPTLFTDPEKMNAIDPLAPAAPFNAARQAATVIKHPTGKRTALVLRPCELRALVELVKLNQCTLDHVVLVGIECLGRLENEAYLHHASEDNDFTSAFYKNENLQSEITQACKICEHFQPKTADLTISVLGTDEGSVGFIAETQAGKDIIKNLGLSVSDAPVEREKAAKKILEKRIMERDKCFEETHEKINSIEGLQKIIATCLNCYNCRTACPVCYCKECVFLTDVFAHRPEALLRRASKRGMVKIPTDTSMFHLTRLAHMSHACVGCGHCSSVCPSNIPVADIFRTVAAQTQATFEYEPGRNVSETIPYLVFEEDSSE